jgi:[ribosomal protein S5]-alanine N-acetyltransferase
MSASIARIITPRLHLFPATRDDAWELWELWSDPAVREPLFDLSSLAPDSALSLVDACARRPHGLWVARSRLTTRALGAVSLCGWPNMVPRAKAPRPTPDGAEFAVATLPSVWHCGFATEAAAAVLAHAFYQLRLREVVAACSIGNAGGLLLLDHLGFKPGAGRTGSDGQRAHYRLEATRFRATRMRPTATPAATARDLPADFVVTDQVALDY